MDSSRCLPYTCVRLGISNQKVESRDGLEIALMASFTPRISISILWYSHTITVYEHNNMIAGDITTIQNDLTKCPAIQNLTGHLCPDRIKTT